MSRDQRSTEEGRRRPGTRHNVGNGMLRSIQPTDTSGRLFLILPVLVLLVAAATFYGWQKISGRALNRAEFRLDARQIVINQPPAWITADRLKADVIRDASLDRPLSILDEKLNEHLAAAFAAHPWVAEVARVEKFHPARVEVELVYRHPIAVVATGDELLPIDRHSVALPYQNFALVELERLPAIRGVNSHPGVTKGSPWGDPRVAGAARIASAFGNDWYEFDLADIIPSARPIRGRRDVYTYVLVTRRQTRIRWGPEFPQAHSTEPSAAEKCARLREYVKRYGTLDATFGNGPELSRSPTPHKSLQ